MKNTNTKEFKEKVFTYLCDSLYDFEGDREARVRRIWEKFQSEFNYPYNRQRTPNLQARVADWLQGLPLNIDFSYVDILARAEEWHECKLTEKQAETIENNWFNFLALKLLQMCKAHGIDVYAAA